MLCTDYILQANEIMAAVKPGGVLVRDLVALRAAEARLKAIRVAMNSSRASGACSGLTFETDAVAVSGDLLEVGTRIATVGYSDVADSYDRTAANYDAAAASSQSAADLYQQAAEHSAAARRNYMIVGAIIIGAAIWAAVAAD